MNEDACKLIGRLQLSRDDTDRKFERTLAMLLKLKELRVEMKLETPIKDYVSEGEPGYSSLYIPKKSVSQNRLQITSIKL